MISTILVLLCFTLLPSIFAGSCPGLCQNIDIKCSVAYTAGLCPGGNNIECCKMATPSCSGQCQDNSLPCSGHYTANECPGGNNIQCCSGSAPPPPPVNGTCATFANNQWDCATPTCATRVSAGTGQPSYQCAEFVSRTLASAGLLPISALAAQSSYLNFHANGKTYDLLWVSSKQGGPLGLDDYLKESGWTSCGTSVNCVNECSALMVVGSEGPYSHTVVGVGKDVCDAHNVARYHVSPTIYNIDNVWNPPREIQEIVARQRMERAKLGIVE